MNEFVVDALNTLGQGWLVAMCFMYLLTPKYGKILTTACVMVSIIFVELGCVYYGTSFLPHVIAYTVAVWILVRVFFIERKGEILKFGLRIFALDLIAELMAGFTFLIIVSGDLQLYVRDGAEVRIGTAFFNLYFLSVMAIYFISRNVQDRTIGNRLNIAVVLMTAYQVVLLLVIFYAYVGSEADMLRYGILVFVVVLTQTYCIAAIMASVLPLIAKRKDMERIQMQQSMELEQYRLTQESEDKMHRLKHDFSNHLQTVLALSGQKNYALAEQMLKQMEIDYTQVNEVYYCENAIINTVLVTKTALAQRHGIDTKITVDAVGRLEMADIALCSIVANLYDNAIEACQNLEEGQRWLEIKIGIQKAHLVMVFTNPYEGEILPAYPSRKLGESHGYGLKIVKESVGSLGGDTVITADGQVFKVVVTIKL